MVFNFSTGSSSNLMQSTAWQSQPGSSPLSQPDESSALVFQDLLEGRCTLSDIMNQFGMNDAETPRSLDENTYNSQNGQLAGMGPPKAFLRQKSCPTPEHTPAPQLPRPASHWILSATAAEFFPNSPGPSNLATYNDISAGLTPELEGLMMVELQRVLSSLPDAVLFSLLRAFQLRCTEPDRRVRRHNECKFCKNNGEREAYYRSHALKDAGGRVTCPVLRAYVCRRCGAGGDSAHTTKYCPLTTPDERMKSTAMMRSVRMASGRRRGGYTASNNYSAFVELTPSTGWGMYNSHLLNAPLDPSWAAVEEKLSNK